MDELRKKIVATLRKPPNDRPAHVDRLPWDQVELIADAIMADVAKAKGSET